MGQCCNIFIVWLIVYLSSITCYIPYSISFSIGTIAACNLAFTGNKKRILANVAADTRYRVRPILIICFIAFPKSVHFFSRLLPKIFNQIEFIDTFSGWMYFYPSPLHLLLPVIPIVVVHFLRRKGFPCLQKNSDWRLLCLIGMMMPLFVFLIFYRRDIISTRQFLSPEMHLFLGLKSFFYNGLWEELHYRYLLLPLFFGYFSRWTSVILVSLLFSLMHFELLGMFLGTLNPACLLPLFGIFVLGLATGYCFFVTGSIVPCIILHGMSSGLIHFLKGWDIVYG